MKIRNGFVSNSSSSSFIIKLDKNFPDTISIAKSMLKDRFAESEWGDKKKIFKNLENLKRENNIYIPIYFTSCNYNTYIIPITNNYVLIETCNNTRWVVEDDAIIVNGKLPDEIMGKYPNSEGYSRGENYICKDIKNKYNEYTSIQYNTEYYLVEHGLFLSTPDDYKTCKKCHNEVWVYGNQEVCLNCDKEKIVRGFKLKKIKNAIKRHNT